MKIVLTFQGIEHRFQCIRCGSCCSDYIRLTPMEAKVLKKIASDRGLSDVIDDIACVIVPTESGTCPFVVLGNVATCTIYGDRPGVCRLFPIYIAVPRPGEIFVDLYRCPGVDHGEGEVITEGYVRRLLSEVPTGEEFLRWCYYDSKFSLGGLLPLCIVDNLVVMLDFDSKRAFMWCIADVLRELDCSSLIEAVLAISWAFEEYCQYLASLRCEGSCRRVTIGGREYSVLRLGRDCVERCVSDLRKFLRELACRYLENRDRVRDRVLKVLRMLVSEEIGVEVPEETLLMRFSDEALRFGRDYMWEVLRRVGVLEPAYLTYITEVLRGGLIGLIAMIEILAKTRVRLSGRGIVEISDLRYAIAESDLACKYIFERVLESVLEIDPVLSLLLARRIRRRMRFLVKRLLSCRGSS